MVCFVNICSHPSYVLASQNIQAKLQNP
uniref:Uncharacterized protein n=1 Tax=Anguilla anguilla TaxID=7936 RepID=A0A0E9RLN6_ANGAN